MADGMGRKGRPARFRQFDDLLASCPDVMRRPQYRDRIGVRRGPKGDTVWVKVQLQKGGTWKGRRFPAGHALEVKLGWKSSIDWAYAVSVHDDLQERADKGKPLEDEPVATFEDHAQDWLERKRGTVKDFSTMQLHVDRHLSPTFGPRQINEITSADIERWIALKRNDGLSPGYVKRMNNTLKAILYDAQRMGSIDRNPATEISPIKGAVARQRFLSAEEIVRLVVVADELEPWLADVIVWALHSGMRRGEIQSMRWSDIRDLPEGGKITLLGTTKSGKPRNIICTRSMIEVLEHQAERIDPEDDRVFPVSKMT